MGTFQDLYNLIQKTKNLRNMQVYSNRQQVNLLNIEGLSIMNICFSDDEVHMYQCPRPGYADYSNRIIFNLDENLTSVRNYMNGSEAYAILANA